MTKPALGRGLNALLSGASPAAPKPTDAPGAAGEPVRQVPLDRLRPCSFQPRRDFAPGELEELAASIREQGILQPLIVRPQGDGWELIAGERRWRAARVAGLTEIPVLVREADDRAVLELALIENLQREDLNPIEEAEGYRQLADRFRLRQEDIAARVGKSRVAVANALRLLKLPDDLRAHVRQGRLSVGHAKVILGLESADQQALAADRILRENLNVRQTEDLVNRLLRNRPAPGASGGKGRPTAANTAGDPQLTAIEEKLQERFGTQVKLRYRKGRGSVELQFFSDDDLQRILDLLDIEID